MLLNIAICLVLLWVLAYFALSVAGGLIHLLLLVALVVLILNFVPRGRRDP